jgi:hypothetical protein
LIAGIMERAETEGAEERMFIYEGRSIRRVEKTV